MLGLAVVLLMTAAGCVPVECPDALQHYYSNGCSVVCPSGHCWGEPVDEAVDYGWDIERDDAIDFLCYNLASDVERYGCEQELHDLEACISGIGYGACGDCHLEFLTLTGTCLNLDETSA